MAGNDEHAPVSASGESERDHGDSVEGEVVGHDAPEPVAPAAPSPRRRKRGFGQKFTLFVSGLGLLATLGGGAAIVFKDRDERLRAVADALEGAAKDPQGFLRREESELGDWLTKALPGEDDAPRKLRPHVANVAGVKPSEPEKPAPESPKPAPTQGWAAPREVPAEKSPPVAEAPPSPKVEPPKIETFKPASDAPVASTRSDAPPAASEKEIAALERRLTALEENLREALEAAKQPRGGAAAASPGEGADKAGALDLKNDLLALKSRVEDLSEVVENFRARLDQPKVEARADAQVEQTAHDARNKALTAMESLALAQSLRLAFERGDSYQAEFAALQERGADAQLLAPLAPFAERGAPTAKDLLAMFLPLGKRLRGAERPAEPAGSLTDELLHDAEKLVRVRPITAGAKATAEDLVPQVERALAHDDLGAASAAFAKLPEMAKGQAKEFGDALNRRVAAEKAASQLLRQSISALGRDKN